LRLQPSSTDYDFTSDFAKNNRANSIENFADYTCIARKGESDVNYDVNYTYLLATVNNCAYG